MNRKRVFFSILAVWLAIVSCNLPSGTPATDVPIPTLTDTAQPIPADTATPTFTATATETPIPTPTVCQPTVTTNTNANVRSGPGQMYNVIGSIPQGGSANVAGKSYDGTWWYIEFSGGSGGFAWIAGSVTNATCIPDSLALITAPPTPILPTITPTNTLGILLLPPLFKLPTPTPTLGILIPLPIIITIGP